MSKSKLCDEVLGPRTAASVDLTPRELQLPYDDWCGFIARERQHLDADARRWLGDWEQLDLALSPMDDDQRRFVRLGHYHGWFKARYAR